MFAHVEAALSGPDLFITPWGDITGQGPLWQTPDIFVVDAFNNVVNAQKGIVNRLRARVRNIGNSAAQGAVIRFRYAPIFLGLSESAFEQIDAPTADFAAAGDPQGNDVKIVPVSWDLTNLNDTNNGQWPQPISAFDHFCAQVSVDYPPDVNTSNNFAQNNFVDVQNAMTANKPTRFIIGNPRDSEEEAEILLTDLPEGLRAELSGVPEGIGKPFRLKPHEIRSAEILISSPPHWESQYAEGDVVANLSLRVGKDLIGGTSLLLRRGWSWRDAGPGKRGVTVRLGADADAVFKAILELMSERKEPIALADRNRLLITSGSVTVGAEQLWEVVSSSVRGGGS